MTGEVFLTLALLFLTSGVPANAQKSAGGGEETVVRVAAGAPLTLECPLRVEQPVQWRLNDSAVPSDMRPAGELTAPAGQGRLTARLHAPAARTHHAGLYTCSRGAGAHRVRLHLTAPEPSATTAPAAAAAESGDGGDARAITELPSAPVLYYDINRNLTLNCSLTSADASMPYVWKKNDIELELTAELKGRYKLDNGGATFAIVGRSNEEDYGNYSCALGAEEHRWEVHGRPVARLPDNTNVVEGQKLKLQCKVIGKPYPRVTWSYKASAESNESRALVTGGRVTLEANEQGAEDGALVLQAADKADAGLYTCRAGAGALASDVTVLRVKDMYAALWPFLGICLEVLILCAIILVYEKRRTKPSLDDSDTDNHDQKKS